MFDFSILKLIYELFMFMKFVSKKDMEIDSLNKK